MRDLVFFPLIGFVVAAMIVVAMRPIASETEPRSISGVATDYRVIPIEGDELQNVFLAPNETARLERAGSGLRVLVLSSPANTLPGEVTLGSYFRLAADLETAFAGLGLEVTVRARAAGNDPATRLAVQYDTREQGDSEWHTFDLSDGFENYAFQWIVPERFGDQGVDYLGVVPLGDGGTASVEIERITFRRFAPGNRRGRQ